MVQIRLTPTNLRNQPLGEHAFGAYPDNMVDEAKTLRAQGWTVRAIAAALGPCPSTVWRWVTGVMRRPPARVVARRVKEKRPADAQSARSQALIDDFSDLA